LNALFVRLEALQGAAIRRATMTDLGKLLLVLGSMIVLVGAALLLAGRFNLPLGRLPGDIVYRGKNTVFYFPLTTCILISVVLSLLFWLFGRGHR
jgi:hypothetical protein